MIDRRSVLIGLAGAIPALDAAAKPKPKPKAKPKRRKPQKQGHPVHHHKPHGHVKAQGFANPGDGPLVSRYGGNANNGVDSYRPRSFQVGLVARDVQRDGGAYTGSAYKVTDAGAYAGWDAFPFGGIGGQLSKQVAPDWATFDVGRAVTVGYVWRDGGAFPYTGQGWTKGGSVVAKLQDDRAWVKTWPVYTKTFNAGTVNIPSPSTAGDVKVLPWLIFAEGDGTPSPQPSVPNGRNLPAPNDTCPDWVHDQYLAYNTYRVWHPPIDPKYWCYFRHEHGSNPAHAGLTTYYNEVALLMGKDETHSGFKEYVVTLADGNKLHLLHHFGTTGVGRANTCKAQMHTLHIDLIAPNGDPLAMLHYMADFGRALGMFSQDQGGDPINPSVCPDGNAKTGYTSRNPSRQIPITPFGLHSQAYEPWITNLPAALGLSGQLVFNTVDGIDICPDFTCDTAVRTDLGTGTGRFLTINDGFGIHDPGNTNNGVFFTDPMGMARRTNTDPDAVRQFVKPGLNWSSSTSALPDHGHMGGANVARWGDPMITVPTGVPGDAEGSIFATRGPN